MNSKSYNMTKYMNSLFEKIQNDFIKQTLPISNAKLKSIVEEYSILYIIEIMKSDQYSDIYKRMSESKIISICKYIEEDNLYLIICFEQTVIIINSKQISFLNNLFEFNSNLTICFQEEVKPIFEESINIKYSESFLSFNDIVIDQYLSNSKIKVFLKSIISSILRYLIKKSFIEMNNVNRIKDFEFNNDKSKTYDENDYIILNIINPGSLFQTKFVFMFDNEKVCAIKTPFVKVNADDDEEINKLFNREKSNYQKLNHPLLPKFFGVNESEKSIIIEYINGDTLLNLIQKHLLNDNEKIRIIFEITLTI